MATRWGICGTGKIANDFCICLNSLPSSEHQIVAVAASNTEKAAQFASEFDIPTSYGSYAELATNPDIDVVYIATIHINHVENSLMYINAGKSVLCEKPMALTLDGCKKVLAAAKEKGVLFVEGFWSRHFPVYKFIKEHMQSGAMGDILMTQVSFCVPIAGIDRVKDPSLGGGGLMDIGVYLVQAASLVFPGKPESIMVEATKNEMGVDKTGMILLRYPGNKFASLAYSTETASGASFFIIRGSKGNVTIPDTFWCPNRVVVKENEVKYFQLPDVKDKDKCFFTNSEGLVYEAQHVRECLLKGLKESPAVTHEESETISYILQEVQNKLGITYKYP